MSPQFSLPGEYSWKQGLILFPFRRWRNRSIEGLNKVIHSLWGGTEVSWKPGLLPSGSPCLPYRPGFSFYWKHHQPTQDSPCSFVCGFHFPRGTLTAARDSRARLSHPRLSPLTPERHSYLYYGLSLWEPNYSRKPQITCNSAPKNEFFLPKISLPWVLSHTHTHPVHPSLYVNSSHVAREEVCLLFLILFCFWQDFTNSRCWQNVDIFFLTGYCSPAARVEQNCSHSGLQALAVTEVRLQTAGEHLTQDSSLEMEALVQYMLSIHSVADEFEN